VEGRMTFFERCGFQTLNSPDGHTILGRAL
jgi:hypothetical protein